MDTTQLVNGIGVAVAAAKPAQEYCFANLQHWSMCMTKSEWSGWMQAIGAVAAILGSLYIAKRQERKQLHLAKKSSVVRVRLFVSNVSVSVVTLKESKEVNRIEMLRQRAILREALTVGASVSAELLNANWQLALETTRSIAAQLIVLCEAIADDPYLLAQAQTMVATFSNRMEKIEKVVGNSHPGVFFSKEDMADTGTPFFTSE